MKKLLIYGACLLLSMGAVSCHGDDPLAPNTERPVPPVAKSTVSGIVTDADGKPVPGATVTLGDRTTTTDENGYYCFNDVDPGDYEITVVSEGNFTSKRGVTVTDDKNQSNSFCESFVVDKEVRHKLTFVNGGGVNTVETSSIKGNEAHGEVEITVAAEDGTIPDGVNVWIVPVYTSESAQIMETRATWNEDDMLIGATLQCDRPDLVLEKDIQITFNLDGSVVGVLESRQLGSNGSWSRVNSTVSDNGDVVIATRTFTSYGLFLPMTFTTTTAQHALAFNPSEWNNLAGSGNIWVENAPFTYKVGAELTTTATNALEGLLIEHLARRIGLGSREVNAVYPISTSVSVGAALEISGYQEYDAWSLTGGSRTVKATAYGNYVIRTHGWLREHNGGGA